MMEGQAGAGAAVEISRVAKRYSTGAQTVQTQLRKETPGGSGE
jgi:hypothetical protein